MWSGATRTCARLGLGLGFGLSAGCAGGRDGADFPRTAAWSDPAIGCVPRGDRIEVRGILRLRPFGKGADGTVIDGEHGATWIVDYGSTDRGRSLAGQGVVARGRECDKGGASIAGRHLDVESMRAEPAR